MWGTKLPKKAGGKYLVTVDGVVRQACYTEYPEGCFMWVLLSCGSRKTTEVTAWQKEPKPYKPK